MQNFRLKNLVLYTIINIWGVLILLCLGIHIKYSFITTIFDVGSSVHIFDITMKQNALIRYVIGGLIVTCILLASLL